MHRQKTHRQIFKMILREEMKYDKNEQTKARRQHPVDACDAGEPKRKASIRPSRFACRTFSVNSPSVSSSTKRMTRQFSMFRFTLSRIAIRSLNIHGEYALTSIKRTSGRCVSHHSAVASGDSEITTWQSSNFCISIRSMVCAWISL